MDTLTGFDREHAGLGTDPRLPNFFVVGAPKAGTTSLYHYLNQHPEIYMSPVKEPCYFASEVRPEGFRAEFRRAVQENSRSLRARLDQPGNGTHPEGNVFEWDTYLKLFQNAGSEPARGEASVCYLWSATAAANIHAKIPDAKIIMILRAPAERAFSQYLHNAADGAVRGSFRDQIELAARNRSREFHPLYPFLENGLYCAQVTRYLNLFPPANIRVYLYEEAWRNPAEFFRDLFEFLGVDAAFQVDTARKKLEARAPRSIIAHYLLSRSGVGRQLRKLAPKPLRSSARALLFKPSGSVVMNPGDRKYLRDFYREDVETLAGLLNRDLTAWLT